MFFLYEVILQICLGLARLLQFILPFLREFLIVREEAAIRWRNEKIPTGSIWFHVSSVGELEQIRPVVEQLRSKGKKITLSYFSGSVPRLVKDWSFVDYADYLPLDTKNTQMALVQKIKPELLVLNRYDLWPGMLRAAQVNSIPVALINASTPPRGGIGFISMFFRRFLFARITHWAFVDSIAAEQWGHVMAPHAVGQVTGNTRVDRAIRRVEGRQLDQDLIQKIKSWTGGAEHLVLAGSTWTEDEILVLAAFKDCKKTLVRQKLIIVPHEPFPEHVQSLLRRAQENGISATTLSAGDLSEKDLCIVDSRGKLAELYGLASIAYVGGGFGKQIHSIIEPLAHFCPTAIGPRFLRTPEALTMSAIGPVKVIPNKKSYLLLSQWWVKLKTDEGFRQKQVESIRIFLQVHRGAGERIADFLAGIQKFARIR